MKVGDRFSVQIEGMDVAEAVIDDIEDGKAILVIPATRLVVQVRQSLDLAATKTPDVDRIFTGVEESGSNTSEATEAVSEAPRAPVAPVQQTYGGTADIGEGIHNQQLDSSAID